MHWLTERTLNLDKDQDAKLFWQSAGATVVGAKIVLKLPYLTLRQVYFKKSRRTFELRKSSKISETWFWVNWIADHASHSVEDQCMKLLWLT